MSALDDMLLADLLADALRPAVPVCPPAPERAPEFDRRAFRRGLLSRAAGPDMHDPLAWPEDWFGTGDVAEWRACRRLWIAVLTVWLRDALRAAATDPGDLARLPVTLSSSGFREVALLAGFDATAIRERLLDQVTDQAAARDLLVRLTGDARNLGARS